MPAASGIKSVAEFVARARAEPEKYNVAGAAGLPEFAVAAFLKSENLAATKVPYRDVVQAGRDLGEGRIQFLLSSYAVVAPLLQADKVRVVAVGVRTSLVPGAPTVVEAGYPVLHMETTSGFYGPGTCRSICARASAPTWWRPPPIRRSASGSRARGSS